jgi:peptidoglycan/xylan/chitin deacetylase (PgdA/CDA1 family)
MVELKRFWKLGIDLDVFINKYDKKIGTFLFERYKDNSITRVLRTYYALKSLIPRRLQILLRRRRARSVQSSFPLWPIEEKLENLKRNIFKSSMRTSDEIPFIWFWPHGKNFAFVITHDVETQKGFGKIERVCEIERKYGLRSSWNFVPERYFVDSRLLESLVNDGFEIGIHGLKHDGKLFNSRRLLDERMKEIKKYAIDLDAVGFRSPATHRNPDWMMNLPFEYDSSFPDTDPYEPQPGGCLSVFPFFIGNLVELPITLAQDHTLFEILGYQDISIWKQKIDWIEKMNGLALVIIHPDYIRAGRGRGEEGRYPIEYYEQLLQYVKSRCNYWHVLPRNVARWWRRRDNSEIRFDKNREPYIKGPAAKDGVITWIKLVNDEVTFEVKS